MTSFVRAADTEALPLYTREFYPPRNQTSVQMLFGRNQLKSEPLWPTVTGFLRTVVMGLQASASD